MRNIDVGGRFSSLDCRMTQTAETVGDIGGVRELLQSVMKTNPKLDHVGIAAARLKEVLLPINFAFAK